MVNVCMEGMMLTWLISMKHLTSACCKVNYKVALKWAPTERCDWPKVASRARLCLAAVGDSSVNTVWHEELQLKCKQAFVRWLTFTRWFSRTFAQRNANTWTDNLLKITFYVIHGRLNVNWEQAETSDWSQSITGWAQRLDSHLSHLLPAGTWAADWTTRGGHQPDKVTMTPPPLKFTPWQVCTCSGGPLHNTLSTTTHSYS